MSVSTSTAMKFDGKQRKPARSSCSASPHSLCCAYSGESGINRHTIGRVPNHTNVLGEDYCSIICTRLHWLPHAFTAMATRISRAKDIATDGPK